MTTTTCLMITSQQFIKKTDENTVKNINRKAHIIANKLDLHDRIECHSQSPVFITLKDHKDSFVNNSKCQLKNPAKSQIGKVSKIEQDTINKISQASSAMNQWCNTSSVIKWFQNLTEENKSKFLKCDIIDFYSSITGKL